MCTIGNVWKHQCTKGSHTFKVELPTLLHRMVNIMRFPNVNENLFLPIHYLYAIKMNFITDYYWSLLKGMNGSGWTLPWTLMLQYLSIQCSDTLSSFINSSVLVSGLILCILGFPKPQNPHTLHSTLCRGKELAPGQSKLFMEVLKVSLKRCNIPTDSWKSLTSNRSKWRRNVWEGNVSMHQEHTEALV